MKSLKKILRMSGLLLLLILASIGVGFSGGIPVPPLYKKDESLEIKIELVESNEDKVKLPQIRLKK